MDLANMSSMKMDQTNYSEQNGRTTGGYEDRQHEQRQSPYRWWIVLPIILVSMTSTGVEPILLNNLFVERYRNEYGLINASSPSSETACNTEDLQNDTDIVDLANQVQTSVSHLNIIMAGAGAIPAVLSYIILGANSDRIGRRPLLILPCIGKVIHFTILLLIVELNLSDYWFIIANIVDGLFGSNSVLYLGGTAYITDCTTPKERSRAMILQETTVALTRIFPMLGLGFWLQYHGYTLPVAINLGINAAALVYIYLFQPESRGENNREIFYFLKQLKKVRFSPIRGTYQVFLVKRPGNDRRTIILLTSSQIVLFIILFGFVNISPLYSYGKPLCFDVLDIAILTSAQYSLMIVISLGFSIWHKRVTNSFIIPFVGVLMYIVHLVLFGLAKYTWMLYLAVFIGCLFFDVMAVLRAFLTRLVSDKEFALVFIATGIVETLGSYVVGIVANAIYARTIEIYPGIIFFILAGIGIISFVINGFLLFESLCKRKTLSVINIQENNANTADDRQSKRDSSVINTRF